MLRRLFLTTCVFATLTCFGVAFADEPKPDQPEQKPRPKVVTMTVDYNDGVEKRFARIPWRDGMTIKDAMEFASQHKRGIKYVSRGKAATELLHQIDGLKNEGGGGLNWIFRVNEKLGDRSFALVPLKAGDRVLWKFDEYR